MVVSSFAIGALAITVFQLGFVDSLLTIFFINCLAITPVAFFSTFGPRFGLRQMVLSRFYFGFYGVKLIAFLNILACVGWSAVNVIVGAQLINAVNLNIPGYAGIIIIAACTFLITLFGYKIVHLYEFWSWMPSFIIFLIVLGEFAHSGKFSNLAMQAGTAETGSILNFAASVFGFGTGWTSLAADYTVYQPVNVSRVKTFAWVWCGLVLPLCFAEMLGLAVATATLDPVDTSYLDGYKQSGIGGLLAAVLFPPLGNFGRFCLVILALSIIANNCPNIYSLTFALQVMGRWTQAVPRFIWTFIGTLVYVAIAIPGYSHFQSVLENFMLLTVSHTPPTFSPNPTESKAILNRATGWPSTKPSPFASISSSKPANTTSPFGTLPHSSRPASPPSSPSASASSALSWAWCRRGTPGPLDGRLACRGLAAILGLSWRFCSRGSVIWV